MPQLCFEHSSTSILHVYEQQKTDWSEPLLLPYVISNKIL